MSDKYGYIDAFKYYRQSQTKYDYFFIGVILATLSLSVQIKFPESTHSIYLQIITWFSLLISFLSGLFRLERINMFLRVEADKLGFTRTRDNIENARSAGQPVYSSSTEIWEPESLTNEVSNLNSILDSSKNFIKKYNNQSQIAYQIQKWFFVFAIFSYMMFRITNITTISIYVELAILLLGVFATYIVIKFYKKLLLKKPQQAQS